MSFHLQNVAHCLEGSESASKIDKNIIKAAAIGGKSATNANLNGYAFEVLDVW